MMDIKKTGNIMKKTMKRLLYLLVLNAVFLTACKDEEATKKVLDNNLSEISKLLLEKSGIVSEVYTDTTIVVANGIEETEIHFLKKDGLTTRVFILKVDLKVPGIKVKVATPYDSPGYTGQTVPDMAKYIENANTKVLGGVNGDFYDIANFLPRGPLHKNGVVIKGNFTPSVSLPQQALSFIGIKKDGKPIIGYANEYDAVKSDLKEATGGGALLTRNGEKVDNSRFAVALDPRIAIGYTEDDIMYFIVVDGRNFYNSNGATYSDLSGIFYALGTHSSINLDGGGSATMMIRNPEADILQVRNRPSDGRPRAVAHAWMIVSEN
ncbi:phosphodiester glycosidase family protein [Pseudopedobacter saltans]|nr:phosphodiester glycosidase family protein [Pseudopedobacter saltans]